MVNTLASRHDSHGHAAFVTVLKGKYARRLAAAAARA